MENLPRREIVVDGDGHVCEPADLWEKRLPPALRDGAIRLRWNADSGYDVCWVEDRIATDRGLVGMEPEARAKLFGRNALRLYGVPAPRGRPGTRAG